MSPSAASKPAPWRRRLRPTAAVLAGLVPLLVITGCNPLNFSSQQPEQTITVAAIPGIDNANLYLAQKSGYFIKAGVKVEIQRFSSIKSEISAMNTGEVDMIAADYGDMFFSEASSPNPYYRIVADGYDAAPGVIEILTLPGSRITNPSELAGLTVPVPDSEQVSAPQGDPTTLAVASAVSVLQSDGVNLAAVNWKPMGQQKEIEALLHHQYQAILVTGINVFMAQQAGAVELVDACSGPTSGIPLDGFFATGSWLKAGNHAAAARAFQRGLYSTDTAAAMLGPIQAVLHSWVGLTKQQADLVTTGTYPLSTITANLQRTALLLQSEGTTAKDVNVAAMVVRLQSAPPRATPPRATPPRATPPRATPPRATRHHTSWRRVATHADEQALAR
jgi:NitT/TauT family transport system substrate-binding protein